MSVNTNIIASDVPSRYFYDNVHKAMKNEQLRRNMRVAMDSLMSKRLNVMSDEYERESLREFGNHVRSRALSKLPDLLEKLEKNLTANGVKVHFAETAEQANKIILEIATQHSAKKFIKGKSMVSEEIELNHFLEDHGIEAIEADMGEYIIQMDHEKPSHIVMPAIHKSKQEVASLFTNNLHVDYTEDVDSLIQIGRNALRKKFFEADVGISGVNFAIAETGTLFLIENEGNGRLATTAPKVHIAITGIEKVVENLRDVVPLLSLLTRSAIGQHITTYANMISSPRKEGELDGPEELHLVLLDNGRTQAFKDGFIRQTLNCIRCGACMNHCPVYTNIGGQAYGTTYPGPIGEIISPHLIGLDDTKALPVASTLCGACADVCPVKIPIPQIIRKIRAESVKHPNASEKIMRGQGANYSITEKAIWSLWAFLNTQGKLYPLSLKVATRFRALVPAISAWTMNHSKAIPASRSLHELAAAHLGKR